MAFAVVEWFKKESMYGLFARTKKVVVVLIEVAVILTVLHKGSKNQNGCQTVTIKLWVMHTTFQDLKLIPGHPGEKHKL